VVLIELPSPYLLFLGDTQNPGYSKTAQGLKDWAPSRCLAEFALPDASVTTGLPRVSPREAYDRGARGCVIGVASVGGQILDAWIPPLVQALEAGLDLISGMHTQLADVPALAEAVARTGRRYIDVRRAPSDIPIASGRKRSGQRLLTVGTDCALGKKYTALALAQAFGERGVDRDFRASGQTGIMIAGGGIAIDAVISDFAAGAAEMLSPDADPAHWDIIEGQGSLFHPAYAGVALALLHGSQPDVLVLCHDPRRVEIMGYSGFKIPPLGDAIALNLSLGALTNPKIRCGGVSLNTSHLSEAAASEVLMATERVLGLPVADPIRRGAAFERLVDCCLG
jgi:uncharacterized NAD-dependent epimerase/dehydratase family protein